MTMIEATSLEDIASTIEKGKNVLFFTADWCPDCQFIKPLMPEIVQDFPEFQFIEVDRDKFMDLAEKLMIMGIPSFVVIEDGKEIGRLVSKARKTKEEVEQFLSQYK